MNAEQAFMFFVILFVLLVIIGLAMRGGFLGLHGKASSVEEESGTTFGLHIGLFDLAHASYSFPLGCTGAHFRSGSSIPSG